MTYNNYDDSRVQIPREMFVARQRQLAAVGGVAGGVAGGGGGVGDTTRRQLSHKIRSRSHRGGDTGGGQQQQEEDTPPSTTEQDTTTSTSTSLQPGDLGWAEYAGLGYIPLQPHLSYV